MRGTQDSVLNNPFLLSPFLSLVPLLHSKSGDPNHQSAHSFPPSVFRIVPVLGAMSEGATWTSGRRGDGTLDGTAFGWPEGDLDLWEKGDEQTHPAISCPES